MVGKTGRARVGGGRLAARRETEEERSGDYPGSTVREAQVFILLGLAPGSKHRHLSPGQNP